MAPATTAPIGTIIPIGAKLPDQQHPALLSGAGFFVLASRIDLARSRRCFPLPIGDDHSGVLALIRALYLRCIKPAYLFFQLK
jgi:hypothetical protein